MSLSAINREYWEEGWVEHEHNEKKIGYITRRKRAGFGAWTHLNPRKIPLIGWFQGIRSRPTYNIQKRIPKE